MTWGFLPAPEPANDPDTSSVVIRAQPVRRRPTICKCMYVSAYSQCLAQEVALYGRQLDLTFRYGYDQGKSQYFGKARQATVRRPTPLVKCKKR